jgi:NAD(P)-dependent dehydrogenase (short-subunit alcohol dehydrogenase family)
MSDRFAGRNVLVTGGANGMGRSCVDQLAREGASVFIIDKDTSALTALAGAHENVSGAAADVLDKDSIYSQLKY